METVTQEEGGKLWRRRRKGPDLEAIFLARWLEIRPLQAPQRQYRFSVARQWRLDFAWMRSGRMIAVEIDGGIWTRGRHSRGGKAQIDEADKLNEATKQGWRVLRFTTEHILHRMPEVLADVCQLLEAKR